MRVTSAFVDSPRYRWRHRALPVLSRPWSVLRAAAVLERRCAGAGFTPNLSVRLAGGRVVEIDIAFPDRRIAIELDGYAFHSGPAAFRQDLRRADALMRDGWTVRRFSWDDLLSDPDGCVATVVELLAR